MEYDFILGFHTPFTRCRVLYRPRRTTHFLAASSSAWETMYALVKSDTIGYLDGLLCVCVK